MGRPEDPLILLVPSLAAAIELPRRLASARGALAGVYPVRPVDLARAIAEPALLGRGLGSWDAGRDALLASHLLAGDHGLPIDPELPRAPIARVLARTLAALRLAAVAPERLEALAPRAGTALDGQRLRALGVLYRRFTEALEGRFADTAAILREARERLGETTWLRDAEVLLVEPLELDPLEQGFVSALARAVPVRLLEPVGAPSAGPDSFGAWAATAGIASVPWATTPLASIAPPPPPPALDRLRSRLFSPPEGAPLRDSSVELLTGPGEAAEARSIARRLLREAARGVLFEDMGVILPRPDEYAALFTDLFERLGIPFRLHPSLPLRTGRAARSLLLLLRCRGLSRAAVMEFLGFAPVPYGSILGDGAFPTVASWEEASRNAGVTEGIERWRVGLGSYVRTKRREAERETIEARRTGAARRADEASALGQIVEALAATLDGLAGEASWPEWSHRLMQALDRWVGEERDREAVAQVIADAASLGPTGAGAPWEEVENVLEARLEWERVPMDAPARGGVHVGALDAVAGLPFRVVAIPGLVEGGYPGPIRPDPFLLDAEREALGALSGPSATQASTKRQLSLFEDTPAPVPSRHGLPTTQDRLVEARRLFRRAVGQATERLILSYPRADPRSGRERLPSLFFVSAASTLEGRPLDMTALAPRLVEDDTRRLELAEAVDGSERDRARLLRNGSDAALAISAGAPFFKGSLLASAARWGRPLTAYDGLVEPPRDVSRTFDPVAAGRPLSATRLRTYADCGFRYFLESVLHLEPVEEPEDRMGLEPMERGLVFHEVAERFLRERRQRGELPVRDTPALGARLVEMAEEALAHLVEASPPRHRLLWDMERARLHDLLAKWLTREAVSSRGTPTYFEVSFGVRRDLDTDEPHSTEPLEIPLADGRTLRVSGKIDRIDTKPDGTLVVRDYKTGRAPKDEGGLFRGGRQFQIPFYVKAASMLLPGRRVSEAFLDYVDGGRLVSFDPDRAAGDEFVALLGELVDAIARGLFVQDAAACRFCDFTRVCGPQPLVAARQERKRRDPRAARLFRLKEAP